VRRLDNFFGVSAFLISRAALFAGLSNNVSSEL
jgi:hypothetical protein